MPKCASCSTDWCLCEGPRCPACGTRPARDPNSPSNIMNQPFMAWAKGGKQVELTPIED